MRHIAGFSQVNRPGREETARTWRSDGTWPKYRTTAGSIPASSPKGRECDLAIGVCLWGLNSLHGSKK